ncbi:hypothetical protein L207DRAFT_312087 [Hyaloscypha variabilis F]|uniref:Uncharacterized protein n=1 Tax=Hyaloscypha variabilis (strain UAMH 11265 / GT02V1 / F) TaxID=1149755 RepID=A0A2J6RVA2_HYAVF|nr:hypothetical protein L207DRAFT_312087 [Hyaloscypha variabilis F]
MGCPEQKGVSLAMPQHQTQLQWQLQWQLLSLLFRLSSLLNLCLLISPTCTWNRGSTLAGQAPTASVLRFWATPPWAIARSLCLMAFLRVLRYERAEIYKIAHFQVMQTLFRTSASFSDEST